MIYTCILANEHNILLLFFKVIFIFVYDGCTENSVNPPA